MQDKVTELTRQMLAKQKEQAAINAELCAIAAKLEKSLAEE